MGASMLAAGSGFVAAAVGSFAVSVCNNHTLNRVLTFRQLLWTPGASALVALLVLRAQTTPRATITPVRALR